MLAAFVDVCLISEEGREIEQKEEEITRVDKNSNIDLMHIFAGSFG